MSTPQPNTKFERLKQTLESNPKTAYVLFCLFVLSSCGGLTTTIEKGYAFYVWLRKPPQGIVATIEIINSRKIDVQLNPTCVCAIREAAGNESIDWEPNLGLHLFTSDENYVIKAGKIHDYQVHFAESDRNKDLMERGNSMLTFTVSSEMEQGYTGSIPFQTKALRKTKVIINFR